MTYVEKKKKKGADCFDSSILTVVNGALLFFCLFIFYFPFFFSFFQLRVQQPWTPYSKHMQECNITQVSVWSKKHVRNIIKIV